MTCCAMVGGVGFHEIPSAPPIMPRIRPTMRPPRLRKLKIEKIRASTPKITWCFGYV